jgi:putative transposase
MGIRKISLIEGNIYHIYSRSIAEYKIFTNPDYYLRMKELLTYNIYEKPIGYSKYLESSSNTRKSIDNLNEKKYVEVIAYCIMPTHIHLILNQLSDRGISKYMEKSLKSYTNYFNKRTNRSGPLWSGKFSNVLVETEEQLIHLTRYIHLNPVTAYLVDRPEDWKYSSYNEYIGEQEESKLCEWEAFLEIDPEDYRMFVEERKDYQRELQKIKHLTFE